MSGSSRPESGHLRALFGWAERPPDEPGALSGGEQDLLIEVQMWRLQAEPGQTRRVEDLRKGGVRRGARAHGVLCQCRRPPRLQRVEEGERREDRQRQEDQEHHRQGDATPKRQPPHR